MNWLQLTQALKRESGLTGALPVAYATANDEELRLFNWVNWACRDITLMREDWRWRRGMATCTTSSQSNNAAAFNLTDFASWKEATRFYKPSAYRVSDTVTAEKELVFMEYDQFRKMFLIGANTLATGNVQNYSVGPDEAFLLGPAPDAPHFVRADYVKDYTDFAADSDVPAMPTRFHMIIVWRALLEYGGYDAASEVWQRADANYKEMWTMLVASQVDMPKIAAKALA